MVITARRRSDSSVKYPMPLNTLTMASNLVSRLNERISDSTSGILGQRSRAIASMSRLASSPVTVNHSENRLKFAPVPQATSSNVWDSGLRSRISRTNKSLGVGISSLRAVNQIVEGAPLRRTPTCCLTPNSVTRRAQS